MPCVLYIEDNFDNRMLVKRVLMAEGFEFREADNAIDGIQMAVKDPPDLILMDINMPRLSGLSAAQQIREIEALNDVPVIALTANVMKGDREQTLEAGCDGYIAKPIDVDRFPDQVRQFVRVGRSR